jgi:AraC-like DNA-binding protein
MSFRSETGTSPAQWLLEQRLRAAQTLLETSDHTVDQIAHEIGFGNPAALRAHFGRRLRTLSRATQTIPGRRWRISSASRTARSSSTGTSSTTSRQVRQRQRQRHVLKTADAELRRARRCRG